MRRAILFFGVSSTGNQLEVKTLRWRSRWNKHIRLIFFTIQFQHVSDRQECDEEVEDASTYGHGRTFKDAGRVTPRRSRTFSHEPFIINKSKIEQTISQKTQCSDEVWEPDLHSTEDGPIVWNRSAIWSKHSGRCSSCVNRVSNFV